MTAPSLFEDTEPEPPKHPTTIAYTDGSCLNNPGGRSGASAILTTNKTVRILRQGFPDHHARIPWRGKPAEECPDGPQYKAYGNSMCTNVMSWIGRRLDQHLKDQQ